MVDTLVLGTSASRREGSSPFSRTKTYFYLMIDKKIKINNGVPPHPLPWPVGSHYDPQLLQAGDSRNVVDKYRYLKREYIKEDLQKTAFPLAVAIENIQYDFNIGTIVRNANAFNVKTVHIIGKKQWNRRGAMVTDRYLEVLHHDTTATFLAATKGQRLVAVDNIPTAKKVNNFEFKPNTVLIFGAEGPGLSKEILTKVKDTVYIEQYGSTRSVNVGVASGIVLYAAVQALQNT